jgi:formylmethanofuran dehydrogenase subunit E-like metal-binding protein
VLLPRRDGGRARRLERERGERQRDEEPARISDDERGGSPSVIGIVVRRERASEVRRAALFFVSAWMEKVLVMTATKGLMSQKVSTTTQRMKKMLETEYSESMMLYMRGDHYGVRQ